MITQSDFDLVLSRTIPLERLLRGKLEAKGNGLGRMVDSVAEELPRDLVSDLFYLANVRNALVHRGKQLSEGKRTEFMKRAQAATEALQQYIDTSFYYSNRQAIRKWISSCPVSMSKTARKAVVIALRRAIDNSHRAAQEKGWVTAGKA